MISVVKKRILSCCNFVTTVLDRRSLNCLNLIFPAQIAHNGFPYGRKVPFLENFFKGGFNKCHA